MTKLNKKIQKSKNQPEITIHVDNIGVGRCSPTTTHIIVLLATFESGDRYSIVSILSYVMEHFNIQLEDIKVNRATTILGERDKYSWEK